jgi:hypothetical protein
MALLIYQKDNPQQPIIVKGDMNSLNKKLDGFNHQERVHNMNSVNTITGIELESWHGNKIKFMNYDSWSHVVEEKDEVVKKRLAEMEKAQKEKQIMMNKSRNPDLITQPQMMFPRGRGRGN